MEVATHPSRRATEVIPETWKYAPLGLIADVLTGFPFPSSGYSELGTRLLRGSNVKRNAVDWGDSLTQHWPGVTPDISQYLLREGDIVVAMDGSLVGRSFALLTSSDVPSLLLQRVARIRSTSIDQHYLAKWICSARFTAHCDAVKTTTAIPHISPSDIRSFLVAIPDSRGEQQAIAQALSDVDDLLQSLERLIEKKRNLKQAAMQQLLTGQTRLPGFSGEWKAMPLSALGKCIRGVAYKPDRDLSRFETGGTLRLLRANNVQKARMVFDDVQHVSEARVSDAQRLRYHDVLICMANGSRSLVGKAAAFPDAADGLYTFGAFMGCFRPVPGAADSRFVFLLFQTESYRKHIDLLLAGSSINNLRPSSIEAIVVPIPSVIAEQSAIAEVLSDMDAEISALEARLTKTRDLKQGMMQELLTGRTRLV